MGVLLLSREVRVQLVEPVLSTDLEGLGLRCQVVADSSCCVIRRDSVRDAGW